MADQQVKIYLCFEPQNQTCARQLGAGRVVTNPDFEAYNSRTVNPPGTAAAEPCKRVLQRQILDADVTVCVITLSTCVDDWIAWELEVARNQPRHGLVGVTLSEVGDRPPALADCGAIFVPFEKGAVQRAIEWAATTERTSEDFTIRDF